MTPNKSSAIFLQIDVYLIMFAIPRIQLTAFLDQESRTAETRQKRT